MKQRTTSQVADTRARIERWLAELDYSVEAIVREELVWGLAGRRDNSPGIGVAQMTKYTDRVFLQVAYLLEDGFKDRIALLSPDDRAQLIWDIRFLLISLDAPFDGVVEPLTTINFLDSIFIEALSRTSFAKGVFCIHRSYTALGWMLQRRFPEVQIGETNHGTGSVFIN